jgi:hypothetical protein
MPNYTSQTLVVFNEAVGFDLGSINIGSLEHPRKAFGIVEGNSVRVSSTNDPTANSGLIATIGSSITITSEKDIENFRAISTNPNMGAFIYFEFSDDNQ